MPLSERPNIWSGWRHDLIHETQEHKTNNSFLEYIQLSRQGIFLNIIIFPRLQRNPINNLTVKGPDENLSDHRPWAAAMGEAPQVPTPPQGRP